jgi:hypothetical protein
MGRSNGSYFVSKNAILDLLFIDAALEEKGRRAEDREER